MTPDFTISRYSPALRQAVRALEYEAEDAALRRGEPVRAELALTAAQEIRELLDEVGPEPSDRRPGRERPPFLLGHAADGRPALPPIPGRTGRTDTPKGGDK